MIKYILIVLITFASVGTLSSQHQFRVIRETESSIDVEFVLPSWPRTIVDIDGVKAVAFRRSVPILQTRGWPQVPVAGTMIAVPHNAKLRMEVLDRSYSTEQNILLAPVPTERTIDSLHTQYLYKTDRKVYGVNNFFPQEEITLGKPFSIRRQTVVKLSLHPVRYNPVSKTMQSITRMKIRINFDYPAAPAQQANNYFRDSKIGEYLTRNLLLNAPSNRSAVSGPITRTASDTTRWFNPSYSYVRVAVAADGIYKITGRDLQYDEAAWLAYLTGPDKPFG